MAVKHRIGSQLGVYFPVIPPVWAMYAGFLLILAGYVAGLLIPAGDGICHNCEPPTIVIPSNLRHEYDVEGSVGGAGGGTLLALLIVPLVGAAIAAGRNPLPPDRSASAQQGLRT